MAGESRENHMEKQINPPIPEEISNLCLVQGWQRGWDSERQKEIVNDALTRCPEYTERFDCPEQICRTCAFYRMGLGTQKSIALAVLGVPDVPPVQHALERETGHCLFSPPNPRWGRPEVNPDDLCGSWKPHNPNQEE